MKPEHPHAEALSAALRLLGYDEPVIRTVVLTLANEEFAKGEELVFPSFMSGNKPCTTHRDFVAHSLYWMAVFSCDSFGLASDPEIYRSERDDLDRALSDIDPDIAAAIRLILW